MYVIFVAIWTSLIWFDGLQLVPSSLEGRQDFLFLILRTNDAFQTSIS